LATALATRLGEMTGASIDGVRSLLEVSPVWFRWSDGGFEVVIAKGDLKLGHLARDPGAFWSFSKRFDLFAESRCVG